MRFSYVIAAHSRVYENRPARCLANRFPALGVQVNPGDIPSYPIANDAGKSLDAAAKAAGEGGYGAQ